MLERIKSENREGVVFKRLDAPYARVKIGDAIGIQLGEKAIVLLPPTAWKRYEAENPDWKPQGSIPVFQS